MVQARTNSRQFSRFANREFNRQLILVACAIALVAMAMASVGCGKKNDGPGATNDNIAVTPLSSCAAGTTYQGNAWNRTPYGQINAVPYGYGQPGYEANSQTIASQGFCGCPSGTQPMCDGSFGVVCLQGAMLQQVPNIAWYGPGQNGYVNYGYGGYTHYSGGNVPPIYGRQYGPQIRQWNPGYDPGYGQLGRRHRFEAGAYPQSYPQQPVAAQCATQIGQTCMIGTNSCEANSFCRPIAANQAIGVCAR